MINTYGETMLIEEKLWQFWMHQKMKEILTQSWTCLTWLPVLWRKNHR